jgi:XisI protein
MEKLNKYGNAIVDLLKQYVHENLQNGIEEHLISDFEHGHFQLLRSGWADKATFRMGILLHFQLKTDGKIWILANWTEDDVAQLLMQRGVQKQDIVLGFQPEYIRPYSGYAVA